MRIFTKSMGVILISAISASVIQAQSNNNDWMITKVKMGDIYPNPFSVRFFLSFTVEKEDSLKVELFDISGKSKGVYLNSHVKSCSHRMALSEDLKSGIYFLKFTTPDTSIIEKAVFLK